MRNVLTQIDQVLAQKSLRFSERNGVLAFLIHGLFKDQKEISLNHVNPQQAITIEMFKEFIEYYLKLGYKFISQMDILNGLDQNKKYVMITFDDGYFNNQLAVPILNQYKVPAVFFISTKYILQDKCFWWDVIYRERIKRGFSLTLINKEIQNQKIKKHDEIEKYIIENFGKKAFTPISDIDRPFKPNELQKFSNEKYVYLGNHTTNHAILTNYSFKEIKNEIIEAEEYLLSLTGVKTNFISYPNGNFSKLIIQATKACDIQLGVTVDQEKNYLPFTLGQNQVYTLKRFILDGYRTIPEQCACYRSDVQFKAKIKNIYKTLKKLK